MWQWRHQLRVLVQQLNPIVHCGFQAQQRRIYAPTMPHCRRQRLSSCRWWQS
jgi:hypothetical protein